ncbi:enhanced serine sensitivity protein SseB [Streptomyces albireticuli]|uniref:Enhanced serine sensitivity protein SseB n=1 Tax=Streptomyces albireticuli TaxID=1940 RepID=A0A2A2D2F4_9ACTN|nr:enhanced serine sensitivity protein SseB [Streptomyces albireticuli]MCD9144200.1 enhanced serine sensitivity protein SseB [Streptomyces albireticuli]MCD9162157.1 enhanced serine sensitivity protein SseB [Streptomyces albireticuli]MCD9193837.1 enhanced serine sensitivity protein SseB [Streptomyces albireticuli]PAU45705.1 enhanced serine sensitivity protein SseB [Streptomyces albireticuli]
MSIPQQYDGTHGGTPAGTPGGAPSGGTHPGWPANELEAVLAASLGVPDAGPRIVEVLGRSQVWVPLPNGGGPASPDLDLPTVELDGAAFVPVFSSEGEFLRVAGDRMSFAVAPAVEFARGLPPQVGIVVNPEGAVGVPLPPPAVAALCRAGRTPLDGHGGGATGGRVRLFEPDWQDEPTAFLAAAGLEFAAARVVRTARRALASVEGGAPALFVGVELDLPDPGSRGAVMDALGRALGAVPVPWPVQLVFLDVAQDPVTDRMRSRIRPFYDRDL